MTAGTKRQPANTHCAICGRPLDTCNVPGLHGMVRDRAAAAAGAKATSR